jgi:hypothetical protein
LSQSALEVEEAEEEVQHMLAEIKRQGQLLSVLSAQRDMSCRDLSNGKIKCKEARMHVRMKELSAVDLKKRSNEVSNRLTEFVALYEIVKCERNKYVGLIHSSAKGLLEMKEKIRTLQEEMELLKSESDAKVRYTRQSTYCP